MAIVRTRIRRFICASCSSDVGDREMSRFFQLAPVPQAFLPVFFCRDGGADPEHRQECLWYRTSLSLQKYPERVKRPVVGREINAPVGECDSGEITRSGYLIAAGVHLLACRRIESVQSCVGR